MGEEIRMITCRHCKGRKTYQSFVRVKGKCSFQEIDCFTCKGAGSITEEHSNRIIRGETIRLDRINRKLSLRQEALRLGMKSIELARLERGE